MLEGQVSDRERVSCARDERSHAPAGPARGPRVTVFVPCHNYGRYLAQCVGSVLAQGNVEVDVLIINDASTDDSGEVARRLAEGDPRVRVIDHERNLGHIATYNEGLEAATGDYVVLLSADDVLTAGALERATRVMEARPRVGLVYGNPIVAHGDDLPPARTRVRSVRVWSGPDWITAQCRRGLSCIYCPEVVVRSAVQRAVGGYDPALPHTADLDMWLRVAAIADVARVNGSDQAYRRIHGQGMMQTRFAGLLSDLQGRRDAYESFFRSPGAHLPRAERDLATIRRRLGAEALDHLCSQARKGEATSQQTAEFLAFAEQMLEPGSRRSRQWREFTALPQDSDPGSWVSRFHVLYGTLCRDVAGRYRWRRWRLTGV